MNGTKSQPWAIAIGMLGHLALATLCCSSACSQDQLSQPVPCETMKWDKFDQTGTLSMESIEIRFRSVNDSDLARLNFYGTVMEAFSPPLLQMLTEATGVQNPQDASNIPSGGNLSCAPPLDFSSLPAGIFSALQSNEICKETLENKRQRGLPAHSQYFWLSSDFQFLCSLENLPDVAPQWSFARLLRSLQSDTNGLLFDVARLTADPSSLDRHLAPFSKTNAHTVAEYLRHIRTAEPTVFQGILQNTCLRRLVVATVTRAQWSLAQAQEAVRVGIASLYDPEILILSSDVDMELSSLRSPDVCE